MSTNMLTKGEVKRIASEQEIALLGEPDRVEVRNGTPVNLYDFERVHRRLYEMRLEKKAAADRAQAEAEEQARRAYARVESDELITADEVKDEYGLHGHDLGKVRKVKALDPHTGKIEQFYERGHAARIAAALTGKGVLTKSAAMKEYRLSQTRIAQIEPLYEALNSHHRSGAPMVMYSRSEIEAFIERAEGGRDRVM